jgi:hypothetical protein
LKDIAMRKNFVLRPDAGRGFHRLAGLALALIGIAAITGCQDPEALLDAPAKPSPAPGPANHSQVEAIQTNPHLNEAINQAINQAESIDTNQTVTLREGDILKITFAGSPSLNTIQTIRNDGIISMPMNLIKS